MSAYFDTFQRRKFPQKRLIMERKETMNKRGFFYTKECSSDRSAVPPSISEGTNSNILVWVKNILQKILSLSTLGPLFELYC